MHQENIKKESFIAIQGALEIHEQEHDNLSEEDMIIQIERRVAELMERDMGLLMSYLYRLDIIESKINFCLDPKNPFHPYTCLATLIWERQKQRILTKKLFKQEKNIDKDWKW